MRSIFPINSTFFVEPSPRIIFGLFGSGGLVSCMSSALFVVSQAAPESPQIPYFINTYRLANKSRGEKGSFYFITKGYPGETETFETGTLVIERTGGSV